jgi:tetratricopeptide (TPR) repeat protein
MMQVMLFLLVLTAGFAWPPALAKTDKGYMSPGEMFEAMDKSATTYKIDSLKPIESMTPEQLAEIYWPSSRKELEFPWIEDDGQGSLSLTSYPFDAGALKILRKAEAAFEDKKYARAAKLYQKALDVSPQCYFAYIGLGDCRFFTDQIEAALALYQKAVDLNPHDFRGFFFKAHALVKLSRFEEAIDPFVQSLALRPRRPSIVSAVKTYEDRLQVTLYDEPFLPKSLARMEGEAVAVYADPEQLPWFYHAMCKAFWLGEPDHRKELTGVEEHRWSTSEEAECLVALVIGYDQARADDTIPKDDAIERIRSILEAGMVNGFIYYNIHARLSPQVVLLLPASERQHLTDYVSRYVLVPKTPSGAIQTAAVGGR